MAKVKDYGEIHDSTADRLGQICVTGDGQSLFTGTQIGEVKQWNVRTGKLVQNLGRLVNYVSVICD